MPAPIKDAKIDVRVPNRTKKQAAKMAKDDCLSLSTWVQLLVEKEYDSRKKV